MLYSIVVSVDRVSAVQSLVGAVMLLRLGAVRIWTSLLKALAVAAL